VVSTPVHRQHLERDRKYAESLTMRLVDSPLNSILERSLGIVKAQCGISQHRESSMRDLTTSREFYMRSHNIARVLYEISQHRESSI
jgi:hypothetical protein